MLSLSVTIIWVFHRCFLNIRVTFLCVQHIFSAVLRRSAEAYSLIRFIAVSNPQPYYTGIYIRYFWIPAGEKDFFFPNMQMAVGAHPVCSSL